jgi:CheY-like chemotaxis protein
MPASPHPILIVDDDTDVREVLGELLADEGYVTRMCPNGRAALDLLRGGGALPRLILLDLMMPEMDGWQFRAEQLRDASLRNIPVVVMTASRGVDKDDLGGAEVLQKPIGLGDILEAVHRNALHA